MTSVLRALLPRASKVGVAFVATLILTVTTVGALGTASSASAVDPSTIWGTATPSPAVVDSDTASVELGTRFTAVTRGQATGVRFYKTAGNTGTHTGTLWTSRGTRLAQVTFAGETTTGWQTATFATPVTLTAGQSYVVSYHTNTGRYLVTEGFTGASTSPYLRVPTSNAGVYRYGTTAAFPTSTWKSSQYWVDLTFIATSTTTSTSTSAAPAPTSTSTSTSAAPAPTSTSTSTSATPAPTSTSASGTPTASVTPSVTQSPATGFPSAATAGVPAGVSLKPTGALTVTTDGAVVENLDIQGQLYIRANNVTVRNVRVRSGDYYAVYVTGSNARIETSDIDGLGLSGTGGAGGIGGGGRSMTVVAADIRGVENGIVPASGSVIRDSYIHDLVSPGSPHYDGIQMDGGLSNILITNNTVDLSEHGQTAAIMVDNYFGSISGISVTGNKLLGGGFTVYADGQFSTSNGVTAITYKDNVLGRGYWGYSLIRNASVSWSNNRDLVTGALVS